MTILEAARAALAAAVDPQARLERRAEQLLRRAQRGALDAIAPDATEERRELYRVGARWTRSLVLDGLPPTATPGWDGWLAALLRHDAEHGAEVRLSLRLEPLGEWSTQWKLNTAEAGHAATLDVLTRGGFLVNRRVANALRDVQRAQQDVSEGGTRLFSVTAVVTLVAPSAAALEDAWRRLTGRLNGQAVAWRPLTWRHVEGFRQTTLTGRRTVALARTWDTSTLAYSWPAVGSTVSMERGPLWGVERKSELPVFYDPFRHPDDGGPAAPHGVIVGLTGGGQSVAATQFWTQCATAADPPQIIACDPKADAVGPVAALGGVVLALSEEPEHTINVMDLPPQRVVTRAGSTSNPVKEAVNHVVGFVHLACAPRGGPDGTVLGRLEPVEVALVRRAAFAAYRDKDIDHAAPETWDAPRSETPTLTDLHRELAGMTGQPRAHDLALRLEDYATPDGAYGALFARPTTVDLRAPLVCFDLLSLTESASDLRPLAIYLVGAYALGQALREPRRRLLLMDEIAQLLQHPESAWLVSKLYSLGRSFGLGVWSMAQSYLDFTRNVHGEKAWEMSHTRLLLQQQDDASLDALQRACRLTARQRAWLAEAGVGDAVLHTRRGNVALHVTPTPVLLDWLPKSAATAAPGAATAAPGAATAAPGAATAA